MSLVAFISATEAVANRLFKEERCRTCEAQTGVAERFRQAVRLVLPDDEARAVGAAYNPRSRTVHAGRLHGHEPTPGRLFGGFSDPAADFEYEMVLGLRRASAALLYQALSGRLPTRRTLVQGTDPWLASERMVEPPPTG
jgi:hypothetical protein